MTSTRRKRILLVSAVLVFLLFFLALLFFLFLRQLDVDTLESEDIYTRISYPPSDTSWPANATVPIRALATGSTPLVRFELWVNGVMLEEVDLSQNANRLGVAEEWSWVPVAEGLYNLAVRVVDEAGGEQRSEPVSLRVHAPVGHVIRVELEEGETIEDIAEAYEVPVEQVIQPESGPVPAGESGMEGESAQEEAAAMTVYVQHLPDIPPGPPPAPPLPDVDPGDLGTVPEPIVQPPPDPGEEEPQPPDEPGVAAQNASVGFVPGQAMFASVGAPIPVGSGLDAPSVSITDSVWQCRLQLTITDNSPNEDGFYVYGRRIGRAEFELIDTLDPNDEASQRTFDHTGYAYMMYSYVSYYVSAYNNAAEAPSEIVSITEYDPACLREGILSNTTLVNGELVIPPFLDTAYLYAAFEGVADEPDGAWFRVPAEENTFMPAGGATISLQDLILEHIPDSASFEESHLPRHVRIKYELWGWSGGQLVHVGDYSGVYVPMVLLYAADAESAQSDAGWGAASWVNELQVYSDSQLQTRQFSYVAGDVAFDHIIWQISNQPFAGDSLLRPPGMIASGEVQRGQATYRGSFNLDLSTVLRVPGTYYMRMVPMDGANPASRASNTVVIHYEPHGGVRQEPANHLPAIYDVEIASFKPPVFVDPEQWGCIRITETTSSESIAYPLGATVCPSTYEREGIGNIWEQAQRILTEEIAMVREGWDYIANGYDWVFVKAAEFVAEGINAISPVDCGPRCQGFIKAALQTAVSSVTGLPPSIPTSGDLIDRGIDGLVDYGVEFVDEQAGGFCGEFCQDGVRNLLNEAVDETIELFTDHGPGCVPTELAMRYNRNSLCLPDGVRGEPVLGSVYIPPELIVRVTRNETDLGELSEGDAGSYELGVSFEIINETRMGDYIRVCQFVDDYDTSTENQELYNARYRGLLVSNVLQHDGFAPETRTIPWLEPGESIEIPIVPQDLDYNLTAQIQDYGVLEHDSICGREIGYVDRWKFQYLYFDGLTQIEAELYCEDSSGNMGYCGASDYFEVQNPSGPYR